MEIIRRVVTTKNRGIEENTLAILDGSEYNKATHYLTDDRLTFLEAVRSSSISPEDGIPPTNKMLDAIFDILKNGDSLELTMSSFQLLNELDLRFPQLSVSEKETSAQLELVMVEEAWSPFTFIPDSGSSEKAESARNSGGLMDSSSLYVLVEGLAKAIDELDSATVEEKLLRNMLLLQYLVNVLEGDFIPRNRAYKENNNWTLLRESLLNMLLGSRRVMFKSLIKNCLDIICKMSESYTKTRGYEQDRNTDIVVAFPEVESCTSIAAQKLLCLIMELDVSKNTAYSKGLTTRSDGVGTPAAEIITDELTLTYKIDFLSLFLQAFDEPNWKLELIVLYFRKYIAQPAVRTRRSNGGGTTVDTTTFGGILKSFSNINTTKTIIKKIKPNIAQLLLAHGFQAYSSLNKEDVSNDSMQEVFKNMISAFTCLKSADPNKEISTFAKTAIFTAATMVSQKSS